MNKHTFTQGVKSKDSAPTHPHTFFLFEQRTIGRDPLRDVHPLEVLVLLSSDHVVKLGHAQLRPHAGITLVRPRVPKHPAVLCAAAA